MDFYARSWSQHGAHGAKVQPWLWCCRRVRRTVRVEVPTCSKADWPNCTDKPCSATSKVARLPQSPGHQPSKPWVVLGTPGLGGERRRTQATTRGLGMLPPALFNPQQVPLTVPPNQRWGKFFLPRAI